MTKVLQKVFQSTKALNRSDLSGAEIFVLASLLFFGSLMIVMTPLGAGYDEEQHFYRVWQMSNLKMVPEEQPWRQSKFPNIYIELSYRRQPLVGSVGFDYWEKYGNLKLYDWDYYYGSINPRSRYAPPLLLPQALALRYGIGRFDLPALPAYYLTRFAGLLSYLFLTWLAVRLIPFGKWLLAVLIVAPMAVYQASTISADTITNGIGFLFIAGTLRLAAQTNIKVKDAGWLLILFALLFIAKPNIYPLAVLPFLLIPPSRFFSKVMYSLLIFGAIILFGVEVVGWNRISPNPGLEASGNVNATEQVQYIISHPIAFAGVIFRDIFTLGPVYLTQWMGVYGYDYGSVPSLTYVFFVVTIVLALWRRDDPQPSRRTRVSLFLVFLLCYFFTLLSLYLTFTAVAETFVYGVQGRYFIPIMPLLLLSIHGLPFLSGFQPGKFAIGLFSLVAVLVYSGGLILTYHVDCGASYYKLGICYQPFYKNFSPLLRSSPPISSDLSLIQEFVPVCSGLTDVRIRVNDPGNDLQGALELTLVDVESGSTLIQTTVRSTELPVDNWYSIRFPPDWESQGRRFTLTIKGTSPKGAGPLLAYSVRPEYPFGTLFENGMPLEDDVIFQYGCLVGLEKAWQTILNKTE
ncbi:MAG: DUF2142 domain-containing protein [Chloroflexota bacterium]